MKKMEKKKNKSCITDIRWKKLSLFKVYFFFSMCVFVARTHIYAISCIHWTFICMNGSQPNGYYYSIYQFSILLLSFLSVYNVCVCARSKSTTVQQSMISDRLWVWNSAYNLCRAQHNVKEIRIHKFCRLCFVSVSSSPFILFFFSPFISCWVVKWKQIAFR